MNIEEAIKVVRNIKTLRCKECVFDNDTKCIKENGKDCQDIAIKTLLTAYEKEKEKNKELTERVLKLESDKFWDNVVSKNKIKQIIYPTPENEIPIEIQQSEMYKKLVKEVEE